MEQVLLIAGMRTSGVLNAQSRPAAACSYFKAEKPRLSHSKIPPCPGRTSSQWAHAAMKLLELIYRGFPSSLNINKREIAALLGFINSIWNKLCLMTGLKPLCHSWARRCARWRPVCEPSRRLRESPGTAQMNGGSGGSKAG